MIIVDNSITLFDKLNEESDNIGQDNDQNVIQSLVKINQLKERVSKNLTKPLFYNQIVQDVKREFGITILEINHTKNTLITVLYKEGIVERTSELYRNILIDNTSLDIVIQNNLSTPFEKIILNTYFKEVSTLLHMQFILNCFEKSALIDPLTQLQNRIFFNNEMKTLVPLARRENMNFGIVLFNIDRFRAVNDEHGDEFGDRFLKMYAEIIKTNIRSSDIAVRFGGAEFLILLINVGTEAKTIEIATKIQKKLSESYIMSPHNDKFQKTVCAGISMFPDDSDDINEVVKFSEAALNNAKELGRDQRVRYQSHSSGEIDFF